MEGDREEIAARGPDRPPSGSPLHVQRLGRGEGLAELTDEFAFFQPALLILALGLDGDPVREYIAEHPECQVVVLQLPRPVFAGLEVGDDVSLNYTLFLCPLKHWEGLYIFLKGIAVISKDRKAAYRALPQGIPVPDVFALERSASLPDVFPMVRVYTFGVDGTDGMLAFVPAAHPVLGLARPKYYPAEETTLAWARALLSGELQTPPPPKPLPPEFVHRTIQQATRPPEET
jgi:hypothetical protein